MTMLNVSPRYVTTAPRIRRGIAILLVRLGRLINRWIAAAIARHERQAQLYALRQFGDRELRDIGLCRGDLDGGLAEAAKYRTRLQQTRCP